MPAAGCPRRRTRRSCGAGTSRSSLRRRALTCGGAAAVLCGAGAAAAASTPARLPITVTVHPRVVPDRAGTPAHPQGVRLSVRVRFGIPAAYDPPLVRRIQVWFPHGGRYEGGRYPVCRRAVLVAAGPHGCPRASIMGAGLGHATADRTPTRPRITIVNGGARTAWFYTVLDNPAHVAEPLRGTVTPLRGRWSYRLSVAIPRNLQIVAGIPIVLHTLELHAGRAGWLSTTGCPADRRWPWRALGTFTDGQRIAAHGTVACRPS
jgi:hypothetical protein